MTPRLKMRVNVASAVFAGLALRLFFVLRFPMPDSGDAPLYIEMAWNWLKKGIYGFPVYGRLAPVDMRVPGYPAFLAAIFAFAGRSPRAVMLAQVVLDLATCVLIALIAARLAPEPSRRRVALAALWLATLCPFTANYTAVVQTETLIVFLTSLAILLLLETEAGMANGRGIASGAAASRWFFAGIAVGFGTLVRPETPLVLAAADLVLLSKWRRPGDWLKLVRATALLAAGLFLTLLPWAARNWNTLHQVQFLAPRYGEMPGELAPRGFNAWTNTWLWRMRDVYLISWKLDTEELSLQDVPSSAFDSSAERARVSAIFQRYNDTLTLTPEWDGEFGQIARERTARHPLRTYFDIPFRRSLTLWFTPRIELLPYSGRLFPIRKEWQDDRPDFVATLVLVMVNFFYVALAIAGAWMVRLQPGLAFLIAFVVLRTAFFAGFIETPEPRYVLECFPVLIALAAQAWSKPACAG